MKLTTRSEYGLLAMVHLAREKTGRWVPAQEIASARRIPRKYLEQILLASRRARIVRSCKGQQGGYRLAKPAAKITLAELIRLWDGALAPTQSASRYFYAPTPVAREPALLRLFKEVRDLVARKLERTTLEDVA